MIESKLDGWRGMIWMGLPYLLGVIAGATPNAWVSWFVGLGAGVMMAYNNHLIRDLFKIKRQWQRQAEIMQEEQIRSAMRGKEPSFLSRLQS